MRTARQGEYLGLVCLSSLTNRCWTRLCVWMYCTRVRVSMWALTTLSQHLQQSVVAELVWAENAQKIQFLHGSELAGCVVWCLLDPPPLHHTHTHTFTSTTTPCLSSFSLRLQTTPTPTGQLLSTNATHSAQLLAQNKAPGRQNRLRARPAPVNDRCERGSGSKSADTRTKII